MSSNDSLANSVDLSSAELYIQFVVFYGCLSGLIASSAGIAICLTIFMNKHLRTRFYAIVFYLTLCRVSGCLQLLSAAIYRTLRTADIVSSRQLRIVCHTINSGFYWWITLESSLMLLLVVDRLTAVAITICHGRQLSVRSGVRACQLVVLAVMLLKLIPSYLGVDQLERIECVNFFSPVTVPFQRYTTALDVALIALVLVGYVLLIIVVRLRTARIPDEQSRHVALQRQLKLIPALRNLVLLHLGFTMSSRILVLSSSLAPAYMMLRFSAYGGMLLSLDISINILFLFADPEIRRPLVGWLLYGARVDVHAS